MSCGKCKMPVAVYEKGGKGNLIKMQVPRIIESEIKLPVHEGHFTCPSCGMLLARKGKYNDNLTYWIVRGRVNTRKLNNYRW